MLLISQLVILFFIFAILGWIMEVVLKYIKFHRFINRGFLIGPYCPIYGAGVVVVTVLVGGLIGYTGTIVETFFAGFVICGALEYFTSWYMEKLFHARWWDYSQKPMNLNGRIWIGNLILFGLASVAIVKGIAPRYFMWIANFNSTLIKIIALIIVIVILCDAIVSHFMFNIVKNEIDNTQGDDTEEISNQVHILLKDRNLLIRRIHEAYPYLEARPLRLTKHLKQVKQDIHRIKKELRNKHNELKTELELEDLRKHYEQKLNEFKNIRTKFKNYRDRY